MIGEVCIIPRSNVSDDRIREWADKIRAGDMTFQVMKPGGARIDVAVEESSLAQSILATARDRGLTAS